MWWEKYQKQELKLSKPKSLAEKLSTKSIDCETNMNRCCFDLTMVFS